MKRAFIILAALAGFSATAHATSTEPLDLTQSYSGYSSVDVAHIFTYDTYANGDGETNSFAFSAGNFTFTDPFLKSSANPPLFTYFLGVSPDVPGTTDVDTSEHLVLAVASAFAAGIVSGGEDFDTIFTGYQETSLISELELIDTADLDSSDPGYDAQQAAKQAAYGDLFSFSENLDSRLGTAPAFGGPLTLVSFSTGQDVGTATSTVSNIAPGAVPEPASWAMFIVGFGLIGGALRRRERAGARFA